MRLLYSTLILSASAPLCFAALQFETVITSNSNVQSNNYVLTDIQEIVAGNDKKVAVLGNWNDGANDYSGVTYTKQGVATYGSATSQLFAYADGTQSVWAGNNGPSPDFVPNGNTFYDVSLSLGGNRVSFAARTTVTPSGDTVANVALLSFDPNSGNTAGQKHRVVYEGDDIGLAGGSVSLKNFTTLTQLSRPSYTVNANGTLLFGVENVVGGDQILVQRNGSSTASAINPGTLSLENYTQTDIYTNKYVITSNDQTVFIADTNTKTAREIFSPGTSPNPRLERANSDTFQTETLLGATSRFTLSIGVSGSDRRLWVTDTTGSPTPTLLPDGIQNVDGLNLNGQLSETGKIAYAVPNSTGNAYESLKFYDANSDIGQTVALLNDPLYAVAETGDLIQKLSLDGEGPFVEDHGLVVFGASIGDDPGDQTQALLYWLDGEIHLIAKLGVTMSIDIDGMATDLAMTSFILGPDGPRLNDGFFDGLGNDGTFAFGFTYADDADADSNDEYAVAVTVLPTPEPGAVGLLLAAGMMLARRTRR